MAQNLNTNRGGQSGGGTRTPQPPKITVKAIKHASYDDGSDVITPIVITVTSEKGGASGKNIRIRKGADEIAPLKKDGTNGDAVTDPYGEVTHYHRENKSAITGKSVTLTISASDCAERESVPIDYPAPSAITTAPSATAQQCGTAAPATTPTFAPPTDPNVKRMVVFMAVVVEIIAITISLGVLGMLNRWYILCLIFTGVVITVDWILGKTKLETVSTVATVGGIIAGIMILVAAIWPGASVQSAALKINHPEYRQYEKGVYPFTVSEGGMTDWILPKGKGNYLIRANNENFILLAADGERTPSWDTKHWPSGPFRIYATKDLNATLTIN